MGKLSLPSKAKEAVKELEKKFVKAVIPKKIDLSLILADCYHDTDNSKRALKMFKMFKGDNEEKILFLKLLTMFNIKSLDVKGFKKFINMEFSMYFTETQELFIFRKNGSRRLRFTKNFFT